jgi:hypothetical protein
MVLSLSTKGLNKALHFIIQSAMVRRLNSMPYCLNKLSCRYSGSPYWYLLVMIWLNNDDVAMPLGIGLVGCAGDKILKWLNRFAAGLSGFAATGLGFEIFSLLTPF